MRHHVSSWKIVIWGCNVAMRRRHDEWDCRFCRSSFKWRLRIELLMDLIRSICWQGLYVLCIADRFAELVNVVFVVIALGVPGIKKLSDFLVVFWTVLKRRRCPKQLDQERLQLGRDGCSRPRRSVVVFGVMDQVIDQV